MLKNNVYLAGPMRGITNFNFPAFHKAASLLRQMGYKVFNPAEKDEKKHGKSISQSKTGNLKDAESKGFSLREALAADTRYICLKADIVALLPDWEKSKGAVAERALARALGHRIFEIDREFNYKEVR